jgi:hypothetical protein
MLMRELLSDPATPRDASDVDLPMPELGDEVGRETSERRGPIR